MKFLCEQCKAKYQISDDKVAGKTVRMKCRKCGHMIEVRAEVTETSVSRGMPKESHGRTDGPHGAAAAARSPQAPHATPPPAAGSSPRAVDAGASGPHATTNATNSRGLATSLNKKPMAPRPLNTPPPALASTVVDPGPPAADPRDFTVRMPSPASNSSGGALAGAFQKSFTKDDPALRDITGLKEWYVAINGVPVGPVRVAELRRKASLGAVTEDSLVWQEGMEEWRPVKAYSELLALVREAAQSGRPPLAVTGDVRQSTPPPPKVGYGTRGSTPAPRMPGADAFRPGPRSNVLPFAPRTAAAEKLEDPEATEVAVGSLSQQTVQTPVPPEVHGGQADPFAPGMAGVSASPGARQGAPLSVQISPASGSVISPFSTGAPNPAPSFVGAVAPMDRSSVSLGPPILASEAPPQKKGVPWIPLSLVVLAGAFGITAAVMLIRPAPAPAPTPPVASTPPPASVAPPPPPPPAESASADIELPDTPATGDKTPPKAVASAPPKPNASASAGKGAADLSDLLKGSGSGPSTGSASTGSSGGGGSLSEDQIRSVMNQHSLGVRRNCWERATSTGSVNVTVKMIVNGSGQVTSASADGNDPAVAKCIETSVRNWNFPATGGTSTVNIPFKFVRQ